MERRKSVFISYARSTSSEAAKALRKALVAAHIDAYLEIEEIPTGGTFPEHLAEALRSAHVVVVFADDTYFRRPWCVYEYLVAIAPYRRAPDDRGVLDHIVFALGGDLESVLPHLPPPLARRSWPGRDDTRGLVGLVQSALEQRAEPLDHRLRGLDDEIVGALARGGAIPEAKVEVPSGENSGAGPRVIDCMPDTLGRRFFGRRRELWELFHLLETRRAGGAPASCLVEGADGLGKTQLVAEYVWRYGSHYPGGVVWIDASLDEDGIASQLERVASAFGVGVTKLGEQVAGPVLWVVDELPEPDPGERPPPVSKWCPCHQHVTVLATSQRTGVRGLDEHLRLAEPDREAASALLTRDPVDTAMLEASGWDDLAHWVGRMPLALELLHVVLPLRSGAELVAVPPARRSRRGGSGAPRGRPSTLQLELGQAGPRRCRIRVGRSWAVQPGLGARR